MTEDAMPRANRQRRALVAVGAITIGALGLGLPATLGAAFEGGADPTRTPARTRQSMGAEFRCARPGCQKRWLSVIGRPRLVESRSTAESGRVRTPEPEPTCRRSSFF